MRIFRTLLVLGGVAVFLPSPPEDRLSHESEEVDAAEHSLFAGATLAIANLVGLCDRQPGVCETAGHVAAHLEAKSIYSLQLLGEQVRTSMLRDTPPATDADAERIATASARQEPNPSTLRLDDMVPAWRGPAN